MNTLGIIHIIVALLLVVTVLMQSRGTSVGIAFGGGSETYRSKKGVEKFLFYATIILSALFAALSILKLIV
jgi:preprotein translocase subunit SecG